jgi:hypothetical protein
MDFIPSERSVVVRMPSTANLMVDSNDGDITQAPSNILISKPNSILNGFFTRIGVSEVVLNWNVPNVFTDGSNNFVQLDVSGTSVRSDVLFSIPAGGYSVSDALDTIVAVFNALPSASRNGATLAASSTGGVFTLTMTTGQFGIPAFNVGKVLGQIYGLFPTLSTSKSISTAAQGTGLIKLLKYQYIDIVSPELTYNQDLKDATTNTYDQNVLVRWYFANTDDSPSYDKYGFPLVSGMKPICVRRLFSPPKQIKWKANQPIGQLSFQVYDDNGSILNESFYSYKMTLQVSEV